MGHGAAMLGHGMLVYGGIYGEDNKVLDDMCMFDMISKSWAKIKLNKSSHNNCIGQLTYHTMTTCFELGIPKNTYESRLMWIKTPQ